MVNYKDPANWPSKLRAQIGLTRRDRHFKGRNILKVEFVAWLGELGVLPSSDDVRDFIVALDRGYPVSKKYSVGGLKLMARRPDEIGRVLPFPNSRRITIDGRTYYSIRNAADETGISRQKLRKMLRPVTNDPE